MDVCRYTNNEDNVERYKHRKKEIIYFTCSNSQACSNRIIENRKNIREETEAIYVLKCCSK